MISRDFQLSLHELISLSSPQGVAGLSVQSDILIDQVLAWDNSLFRQEIGQLPELFVEKVKAALMDFLDL